MRKCIMCCLAAVAVFGLSQCGNGSTDDPEGVELGVTVEGELTSSSTYDQGRYCDTFFVELEEGEYYTMDLTSPDGADITFLITDSEIDVETSLHDVDYFESPATGEVYFTVSVSSEDVGSGVPYAFVLRSGISGPEVAYTSDAVEVTLDLLTAIFSTATAADAAELWDDKTVAGMEDGETVLSGTYAQTGTTGAYTYTYDVSIAFNNGFRDMLPYPGLTGTAVIGGSISVSVSDGVSSYSGSWETRGTVELSGIWTGTVSFALSVTDPGLGSWSGTITSSKATFEVVSD